MMSYVKVSPIIDVFLNFSSSTIIYGTDLQLTIHEHDVQWTFFGPILGCEIRLWNFKR